MDGLLTFVLTQHVCPFAHWPFTDHPVDDERIAVRVILGRLPTREDAHGSHRLPGLIEEGTRHQQDPVGMKLFRAGDMLGHLGRSALAHIIQRLEPSGHEHDVVPRQ